MWIDICPATPAPSIATLNAVLLPTDKHPFRIAPRDEILVRLRRASAERVREWAAQKQTTDDLGWVSMLSGRDTADFMRKVDKVCRDREYMQRELPPIIDVLGE